jgi:23S rRNA (uracil1939-C5)-methyltransferase
VQAADPPLEVVVERLAYGPDALARHEGRVVFVPYVAPGDRVRVRIVESRAGFLRAELCDVVVAGPDRTEPRCPVFGQCGGCQWQHLAPAAQRAAKAGIVAEQLARLGGLRDVDVRPPLSAAEPWAYRARISLLVEGRLLGFRRARSHALLEIDDCAIADPALVAHLGVARTWVAALRAVPARVTLARAPGGVVLLAGTRRRPGPADVDVTEGLLARHASVRGAILAGAGARTVVGDPHLLVPLEPDLQLEVPADAFTQVNPSANPLLVATVLELAGVGAGGRALDLYCGAGNFTLPLARRGADVLGIERNAVAVDAGRTNAARLGTAGARFACGPVASELQRVPTHALDAVVLDPPRAGAADLVPQLVMRRPVRVVYVSCDPATLARDARGLVAGGYRVARVQPVDLFPQTYHIETVAEFVLK